MADLSAASDPRYPKFKEHLSPGWILGRQIDNSDAQYHTFRENLPYMALLLILHPLLRRAWNAMSPVSQGNGSRATPEEADARLNQRASFDYVFALIFLFALHGVSALKVLLILYINYHIATSLPRKHIPVVAWVFNIGLLFANELTEGYKLRRIAEFISPSSPSNLSSSDNFLVAWASWLDGFGGIMPRWEILFNITVLRLISFNMDHYWSLDRRAVSPVEVSSRPQLLDTDMADAPKKKNLDLASLSERDRIAIPAAAKDFSWRNFVAYTIYAPLYLTGPILSFNDFISQLRHQPASIETPRTLRYALRFVLCLLCMEFVLHVAWVGAIAKSSPDWSTYTPAQLCLLSFINLVIIWLKLLLPWRLFRLWALVDGVDAPENMLRCVSDNYSTLAFWRSWHRSYNRWLVRYIFVPLGGASFASWARAARSVATYLAVFTFVALWHDIQLRLLIWGWLIVLFLLPEVLAGYLFPRKRWEARPTAYRMICGTGAVLNILMMIMANLVGFAFGLEGLESILQGILNDWSGKSPFSTLAPLPHAKGIELMEHTQESYSW
jgi:protein-cysteine N-palmitoyltransferase HHAT